jgi:pimeloyl-ACP methyl ester carboxylesterase
MKLWTMPCSRRAVSGTPASRSRAADHVQAVVLPGSGHWVAEQAPEPLLAALTTFLAPYRDGTATAHS